MIEKSEIQENYLRVTERIRSVALAYGRNPQTIKLVVVTKGHQLEQVHYAIEAGAHLLGENYVEEVIEKRLALGAYEQIEWHMIGHVQSRKANEVCQHFSFLHSLDSLKLARRLDRFAAELGLILPVLLECNISGEESKYGWPAREKMNWSDLAVEVADVLALTNLKVCGLMTMPPFSEIPEDSRPYFKNLRRLQKYFMDQFPSVDWSELSMGMSTDFDIAIQEGATFVRVGTAIMGSRPI